MFFMKRVSAVCFPNMIELFPSQAPVSFQSCFSGTQSFNDRRTCRKVASGRSENDSALVARNKPSTSSTIRSIDASPHDSTMLELVRTFWNDYTSNRHLRSGSVGREYGLSGKLHVLTLVFSQATCVENLSDDLKNLLRKAA